MIRIPEIPGLQGSQVRAPNMRLAAAAAPAVALGGAVADAIGGIGEHFQGVADQAQKFENARQESEARMQLDSAYSNLQIDLEKDPDPVSRINRTKEFFESNRGMAENADYSPQVRDSLRQHYTEFAHKGTVNAAASAADLSQKRAGLALNNELEAAVRNNDGAAGLGVIERAVAQGVLLPEEGDAAKLKVQDTVKRQLDQKAVMEDPAQWMQDNPSDKPAAGYDPVQWENLQDFARGQIRQRTYDATGKIQDGMASGAITTPEQIDQLSQDLRPSVVEELKNNLLMRSSEGYKEKVASPEFQAETYGKISSAIASYNPDDKDADLRLAQIDGAMRNLKPGFLRDKVQKQYDALGKTGELPESKTYGDFALKQIDELNKAGRFGKEAKPTELLTADLVKQGFLKDSEKLQRLGFSSDQADKIIEAAKDPALGQKAFIEGWKDRSGGSVEASAVELATANALRLGHPSIGWNDPQSETDATNANLETSRKYGIAKMKLEEFIKVNPDASKDMIEKEFLKVTGEGIRAEAKAKFIEPKPARGGYVPGETSMNLPSGLAPEKATFESEGLKHGIDPRFLAAISMHETANGQSSAYRNKNNAMGVSNSSGPIAFEETSASIAKMARLLGSTSSGPYKNARTIAEIGKIYAPVGAENDPGSLNSGWAAGVAKYFKQLGGNPLAMIK